MSHSSEKSPDDLLSQLRKLSVASEDSAHSSVLVRKKVSSLKFAEKLEQKPTTVEILSFPTCAKDLLVDVFEAIGPVLRISAAAKSLSVENPRATVLWDPSKRRPKTVTLETEEDGSTTRSCKLLLPVRFTDLPEDVSPQGPEFSTLHEEPAKSTSTESPAPRQFSSPKGHKSCQIREWAAVNFRTVWALLHIGGITVPLVNIYAPVEPLSRKDFWVGLPSSLPARNFVFLGDWNVIEDPSDSSTKSNWLTREVTVPFFNLKTKFNLYDVRGRSTDHRGPKFTRCQTRNQRFIWSTLDRFYAPPSLFGSLKITTVHHADFTLSDHMPTSLLVHRGPKSSSTTTNPSLFFKVDARILKDPLVMASIEEVWGNHKATVDLTDPSNFLPAWKEVSSVIKDAHYNESRQLSQLDQLKFIVEDETSSKYYFSRFKSRNLQNKIPYLKRDDGSVISSQTDLVREVHGFFSSIYDCPVMDAESLPCRRQLLDRLKPALSSAEQVFLIESPTAKEFLDVLHSAPKGHAPGIDGFTYEALRDLWEETGDDFTAMMGTCWLEGSFPASMLEGIIKLIPKDLKPESLHQWRPIALLNAQYKLLAKFIACRLAVILPKALADGTAVFLAIDQPSFLIFLNILRVFQLGSGAKVNLQKTKVLMLGRYTRPPDWLQNGPFQVLSRTESARYLGVTVASDLKPKDAWFRTVISLTSRLQGFSGKSISFEGRCAVLRFLLQTKISFVMSLMTLRRSQQKTIRQLFKYFLWGLSPSGSPKIPLISWDLLAKPTSAGGIGVWDLHSYNSAFLIKYTGSLLTGTPDALWPLLFWSLCRDDIMRPKSEFLLLSASARLRGTSLFSRVWVAWDQLRWCPQSVCIPSSISIDSGIALLCSNGYISNLEASVGRVWACRDLPWAALSSLDFPLDSTDSALCLKLRAVPTVPGGFTFDLLHWRPLASPHKTVFPISFGGAYTTLVGLSPPDYTQILNSRWHLQWSKILLL
ncbi:hypothetical protein R1sor_001928 [Riccia sorocarpa]|uniref:Reverse transcriptase domain-containing protein n=1 Tax=Riccia sorocarpa TaxID=122646 RepID=A0ABD3H1I5_9MARC